jgi:predicted enzyme related to lactoylglutathione lyase
MLNWRGAKNMANTFGTDILIQAEDPKNAAFFYIHQLGFEITDETPNMISLHGDHINLFIERGPALGPVLEVTVDDVEEAKVRLVKNGCVMVKDEPHFPRCYIQDPFGLIYNLRR